MRRIGPILIAVGALLLALLLLLSVGTNAVSFALDLLGFEDVPVSYNPIMIAGLAAVDNRASWEQITFRALL